MIRLPRLVVSRATVSLSQTVAAACVRKPLWERLPAPPPVLRHTREAPHDVHGSGVTTGGGGMVSNVTLAVLLASIVSSQVLSVLAVAAQSSPQLATRLLLSGVAVTVTGSPGL